MHPRDVACWRAGADREASIRRISASSVAKSRWLSSRQSPNRISSRGRVGKFATSAILCPMFMTAPRPSRWHRAARASARRALSALIDLLRIPIGIMGDAEVAGDLRAACETIKAGLQGLPVPAATDLEISSKFRAWCGARRRAWPLEGVEHEQALDVADQFEDGLFGIPSTSAAGLATKLYMWDR
jgi:hypothetical protein